MSPIYAVVDLETTGTDPKKDEIIQIGCVLLQDGKIIDSFSSDVNPNQGLSKPIQNLTGLSSSRLKKAPFFEEIGEIFRTYLEDTIFVAHNIAFDYRFLNETFKKYDIAPLTNLGIDTVTLTQILYPQEISFRLGDLAQRFSLQHENPHQADSDALVTAKLFLLLLEKLHQLPVVTLRSLVALKDCLPYHTGNLLAEALKEKENQGENLRSDIQIVGNLALKKTSIESVEESQKELLYPKKKRQKLPLFPKSFTFRKVQSRMMNLVYDFFTSEEVPKDYFLQAPFGIGKTVGYLFPLAFLSTKKEPTVIATSTILLQHQLLADIAKLNETLPQKIQATVVKAPQHFISLTAFQRSLGEKEQSKKVALYKMMLLVWLTETTTGDFSELNLLTIHDAYFQQIASSGMLEEETPFHEVDFYLRMKQQAFQSNVLLTNHAFLIAEKNRNTFQLPKGKRLVIDEGHHFLQQLQESNGLTFSLEENINYLSYLKDYLTMKKERRFSHFYFDFYEEILPLLEGINQYLRKKSNHQPFIIDEKTEQDFPEVVKNTVKQIKALLEEFLIWHQTRLVKDPEIFNHSLVEKGLQAVNDSLQFFDFNWQESFYWIEMEKFKVIYHQKDLQPLDVKKETWYERYDKILYTGATFQLKQKNFFQQQLQLPEGKTSVLHTPYDYQTQLRFLIPKDLTGENQREYLIKAINSFIIKEKRPLLVLFSSEESLRSIYESVQQTALNHNRELLAQGINGSKEKLLKRFSLSQDAILLGNESFWEGIDLPGEKLETIFVAKLPFENPNWPNVQLKYRQLETVGKNPFYENALPQCSLKLNQAMGRLIRGPKDKGVMVLFDPRFLNSSYSSFLKKNLNSGVKEQEYPNEDLVDVISEFLQDSEVK